MAEEKTYGWFWNEGSSWDGETASDSAEILSHDRETTSLTASSAGC